MTHRDNTLGDDRGRDVGAVAILYQALPFARQGWIFCMPKSSFQLAVFRGRFARPRRLRRHA